MSEEHGHHTNYVKIWAILVGLLVVSVVGPMFEIQWLTLATAFGIAVVKAYLVAKKFMHIDQAPKFITYVMATCLLFMLLFFAGTAPDVMKAEGQNWTKPQWIADAAADAAGDAGGTHGEAAHH